ncbi:MAG: M15 family metallopeptidase [Ruminococcus sp.]|nr:M15 family metallopeptidase [Ruminococcus sp.]
MKVKKTDIAADPSGFVLLADYVPAVIQEIRYYSTYNFIGDRIDGYEEPCALLTKEAARALRAVSNELSVQGYRLKVFDAYRPVCAVRHFILWGIEDQDIRMKPYFYPDLEKQELFEKGYIAKQSSHSRGSAVDLTLLDMRTGKEPDMGGPFDFFGELSHPGYRGVTQEQYENRMILQRAMIRGGFEPIDCEWWHFTLRDEPYPDTYFDFPVSSEYLRR